MTDAVSSIQHPFGCYTLNPDGSKKSLVGGSYDNISAVTIACAVYAAIQGYSPTDKRQLAVFDDTDTMIAVIGAASDG